MRENITVRIGNREYSVEISETKIRVNGTSVGLGEVHVDGQCGLFFTNNDTKMLRAVYDQGQRESFVQIEGREFPVAVETERDRLLKRFEGIGGHSHHHAEIRASMPGLVIRLAAKEGSDVTKGQALLILEAMKMENEIRSPADGLIKSIHAKQGQTVEKGDLLIVLD